MAMRYMTLTYDALTNEGHPRGTYGLDQTINTLAAEGWKVITSWTQPDDLIWYFMLGREND
jgi:hypothetical protein